MLVPDDVFQLAVQYRDEFRSGGVN
jgi:hypothetical protein